MATAITEDTASTGDVVEEEVILAMVGVVMVAMVAMAIMAVIAAVIMVLGFSQD